MVGLLRTHLAGAVLVVLLLPLAASCSGNGGDSLPSRTGTPSRTLTASGPSVALPSVTRESDVATEEPTAEPTAEESEAAEPTVEVSTQESATAAEPSESGGSDAWPLWALVALVVVGIVVALWLHRQSRRRDEHSSFDVALSEADWLGRDLLPTLLTASRDERRGAWSVSRPRVVALEDRLAGLATPGSGTVGSLNAQHLETAVIGVRSSLDDESRAGGLDSATEALGAVKQAARQLDQVLADLLPAAPRRG